jgi:hypothetical protein
MSVNGTAVFFFDGVDLGEAAVGVEVMEESDTEIVIQAIFPKPASLYANLGVSIGEGADDEKDIEFTDDFPDLPEIPEPGEESIPSRHLAAVQDPEPEDTA